MAESPAGRDRGELGIHVEGHAPRAHGQRQSPGVRAVLLGVSFSVMMRLAKLYQVIQVEELLRRFLLTLYPDDDDVSCWSQMDERRCGLPS